MNTKPSLTTEQLAALRAFAAANGRCWKSALNNAWMTGRYCDYNGTDDEGSLQQVRNTFGPAWLVRFSLKEPYGKPYLGDRGGRSPYGISS